MHVIRTSAFVHINACAVSTCKVEDLYQIVCSTIDMYMHASIASHELQSMSSELHPHQCFCVHVHASLSTFSTLCSTIASTDMYMHVSIASHEYMHVSRTSVFVINAYTCKFVDLYQILLSTIAPSTSSTDKYMHVSRPSPMLVYM